MTDLVEFLRARNGEAHERAMFLRTLAAALPSDPTALLETADWIEAEVDAKRRLIELHRPVRKRSTGSAGGFLEDCQVCDHFPAQYPCMTLRLLALPYADRPDYREEWAP